MLRSAKEIQDRRYAHVIRLRPGPYRPRVEGIDFIALRGPPGAVDVEGVRVQKVKDPSTIPALVAKARQETAEWRSRWPAWLLAWTQTKRGNNGRWWWEPRWVYLDTV